MEIVAHGLWAAAADEGRISIGWTVWWIACPDVLAFGLLAYGQKTRSR
jgi:hypothetical protein